MLKALKVSFKAHEKFAQDNLEVADVIRKGLKEAKLIHSRKIKAQTLEGLLDELLSYPTPDFSKELKRLAKKYPSLKTDISKLVQN